MPKLITRIPIFLAKFPPIEKPLCGDGNRPCKDSLGMGTASILGLFGEKSPKNLEFRGGDGSNILGDLGDTWGTGAVQTFGDFQRIFGESIFSCKIIVFTALGKDKVFEIYYTFFQKHAFTVFCSFFTN